MGYMINQEKKDMEALDSDNTSDFISSLSEIIVAQLKKQEKQKDNSVNTDGIIDVALTLQDCFKDDGFSYSVLKDYAQGFVIRFEKYINELAKKTNEEWDGKENKKLHLTVYRKILKRIRSFAKDKIYK